MTVLTLDNSIIAGYLQVVKFFRKTVRKIFITPARKMAPRILLFRPVRLVFEEISQIYANARVQERLDVFQGEATLHRTFQTRVLDVDTDFNPGDAKALQKVVQLVHKDGVRIVEIGSWKGYSTAILARMTSDFHGHVFAVDHWRGSAGVPHHEAAQALDVYSIFKRNLTALGLWEMVHPLVMGSQTAAQIFADGILDLVFIDADHRYQYVKSDILSWLPKLRKGGILCGHDCEEQYSKLPEDIRKLLDERREEDTVDSRYHGGVIRALYDCFDDKYSKIPDSTIWYYIKET